MRAWTGRRSPAPAGACSQHTSSAPPQCRPTTQLLSPSPPHTMALCPLNHTSSPPHAHRVYYKYSPSASTLSMMAAYPTRALPQEGCTTITTTTTTTMHGPPCCLQPLHIILTPIPRAYTPLALPLLHPRAGHTQQGTAQIHTTPLPTNTPPLPTACTSSQPHHPTPCLYPVSSHTCS